MPDRDAACVRCHGSGQEPIHADVTINGLPLTLGQLRHLLNRTFWKQTKDADLNTISGCEQAATVAADYLSWLSPEDNVSEHELARWEERVRCVMPHRFLARAAARHRRRDRPRVARSARASWSRFAIRQARSIGTEGVALTDNAASKCTNVQVEASGGPDRPISHDRASSAASKHRAVIDTDYPLAETLDRCIELAEKVEYGTNTPNDDITLIAHLRTLRNDLELTAVSGV